MGNYDAIKDEILEIIMLLVNYSTRDYDEMLIGRFDELVDIVRRVFPKEKEKIFLFRQYLYEEMHA